jgi:hypothetical protein
MDKLVSYRPMNSSCLVKDLVAFRPLTDISNTPSQLLYLHNNWHNSSVFLYTLVHFVQESSKMRTVSSVSLIQDVRMLCFSKEQHTKCTDFYRNSDFLTESRLNLAFKVLILDEVGTHRT